MADSAAKIQQLKALLQEAADLGSVNSVLGWDQQTYMPVEGNAARSRQSALIGRLQHERNTDPAIGHLLDELTPYAESLPYDHDDASLIRATRRAYEQNIKVPSQFMGGMYEHMGITYDLWTRARPANDFSMVRDALAKTLDLSRQLANYFPGYAHIADPLIDFSDTGMTTEKVRTVFGKLRAQLVPLVAAIAERPAIDDSFLRQHYPQADQMRLGVSIITDYGFDFGRGRQDLTHHPFMTRFSSGDVRITTRFDEYDVRDGLFSTLHETGHALYELGIDPRYDGSPLGGGTSSGVHESQSRMWENIVGRSLPFWTHYYPQIQSTFPKQLGNVPLDAFYRAINKVNPSLIRVDADEVTYNLHVMIRFNLEVELLEGTLSIDDLPEVWRARYTSDLGITPSDDKDGILQDVHWYGGIIGGQFQGYTLGNLISAQIYEAALQAHPEITREVGAGKFSTLLNWLRQNVHQHGSKFLADELIERVTGSPLQVEPLMRYLNGKFGGIYGL